MSNGLEKAYSSTLKMEQRDHGRVVIKTVDAKERKNEMYFHERMCESGLPSMKVHEEGETIILDFIENAETLGDHETVDNYRSFGGLVRKMHDIAYDHPACIDQNGKQVKIDWKDFIEQRLISGRSRQHESTDGLDESIIDRLVEFIKDSEIETAHNSVLLHGDLHANNVLKKDGDMILFDKADQILAGDPMYDLALIVINLPGAMFQLGENVELDFQLLEAFIEGYGTDFTVDIKKLQAYILLRSMERWPNPFETEIPDIVKKILNNEK